jgi:hypothetical protein
LSILKDDFAPQRREGREENYLCDLGAFAVPSRFRLRGALRKTAVNCNDKRNGGCLKQIQE